MFSYPFVFIRWPITRDVPWVNLLLFGLAGVLVVTGLRAGWRPGRWRIARILSSTIAAGLSAFVAASFIYAIGSRAPRGVLLIFYRGYW